MKLFPCKKCSCGAYNDITAETCTCGRPLEEAREEDLSEASEEQLKNIDTSRKIYFQKCGCCGKTVFFTDKEKNYLRCPACGKKRSSFLKVDLYEISTQEEEKEEQKEPEAVSWADFSPVIGGSGSTREEKTEAAGITLTSADRKDISVALNKDGFSSCTFGRSEYLAEYLACDTRVSNDHCTVFYKDGDWYVKDNDSTNGTEVNSEYIGKGGERMLSDGDMLKLGRNHNSPVFLIKFSL